MLRRTRSRNIFSWASASGTWRLPRTKNIFSRPTAYRTTSPSSTSQISKSSRRSRSASFLGASRSHSSDSFGVRFTLVGETTRFAFPPGSRRGDRLRRVLRDRRAGATHGGGCHSGDRWDRRGLRLHQPHEPDVGMMYEMTTVDAPAVAIEG